MADEDALIAKAARVLLPYLSYTDDDFPDEVARAVVDAVRDQIASEALREVYEQILTASGGWHPEVRRGFEKAAAIVRARAEALGATESDGEGEDGGLGGREAAGPGNRDSGGNE